MGIPLSRAINSQLVVNNLNQFSAIEHSTLRLHTLVKCWHSKIIGDTSKLDDLNRRTKHLVKVDAQLDKHFNWMFRYANCISDNWILGTVEPWNSSEGLLSD